MIEQQRSRILPRPLSLDAFVAFTWVAPRARPKISPAEPVGAYRAGGYVVQMGMLSRWRL